MRNSVARNQFLGASLLVVMVLSSVAAGAETNFKRIVFFGDSLSDPGNAFVILGKVSVRPFEVIPDYPYARGGKHFSNGPTWAEQFAKSLTRGLYELRCWRLQSPLPRRQVDSYHSGRSVRSRFPDSSCQCALFCGHRWQ